MIYFNENDPFAAKWIGNLFPEATIDQRSIADVQPADLLGYERCHFFGGIAGWEEALQLAEWPAGREVWTGSCPCQPFSAAGKRKGEADERHLWPQFRRLIAECRPATIFGEQVSSSDGLKWLAGVRADLEAMGYAFGAIDLPAGGIAAPQKRQRLWWVASAGDPERRRRKESERQQRIRNDAGNGSDTNGMGVANGPGLQSRHKATASARQGHSFDAAGERLSVMEQPIGNGRPGERTAFGRTAEAVWTSAIDGVGNASKQRLQVSQQAELSGSERIDQGGATEQPSCASWPSAIVHCRDGRARRISSQPGDEPLAYGIPTRKAYPGLGYLLARLQQMGHSPKDARRFLREARANRPGRLRGYGNAIVPQLAAVFIRAFMETEQQNGG